MINAETPIITTSTITETPHEVDVPAFLDSDHLLVYECEKDLDSESFSSPLPLTEGDHYSVSQNPDGTGTVTITDRRSTDDESAIVVLNAPPAERILNITPGGIIDPEAIHKTMDQMTLRMKYLEHMILRSVRFDESALHEGVDEPIGDKKSGVLIPLRTDQETYKHFMVFNRLEGRFEWWDASAFENNEDAFETPQPQFNTPSVDNVERTIAVSWDINSAPTYVIFQLYPTGHPERARTHMVRGQNGTIEIEANENGEHQFIGWGWNAFSKESDAVDLGPLTVGLRVPVLEAIQSRAHEIEINWETASTLWTQIQYWKAGTDKIRTVTISPNVGKFVAESLATGSWLFRLWHLGPQNGVSDEMFLDSDESQDNVVMAADGGITGWSVMTERHNDDAYKITSADDPSLVGKEVYVVDYDATTVYVSETLGGTKITPSTSPMNLTVERVGYRVFRYAGPANFTVSGGEQELQCSWTPSSREGDNVSISWWPTARPEERTERQFDDTGSATIPVVPIEEHTVRIWFNVQADAAVFYSRSSEATATPSKFAAPTGFNVTPGTFQLDVSWDTLAGADDSVTIKWHPTERPGSVNTEQFDDDGSATLETQGSLEYTVTIWRNIPYLGGTVYSEGATMTATPNRYPAVPGFSVSSPELYKILVQWDHNDPNLQSYMQIQYWRVTNDGNEDVKYMQVDPSWGWAQFSVEEGGEHYVGIRHMDDYGRSSEFTYQTVVVGYILPPGDVINDVPLLVRPHTPYEIKISLGKVDSVELDCTDSTYLNATGVYTKGTDILGYPAYYYGDYVIAYLYDDPPVTNIEPNFDGFAFGLYASDQVARGEEIYFVGPTACGPVTEGQKDVVPPDPSTLSIVSITRDLDMVDHIEIAYWREGADKDNDSSVVSVDKNRKHISIEVNESGSYHVELRLVSVTGRKSDPTIRTVAVEKYNAPHTTDDLEIVYQSSPRSDQTTLTLNRPNDMAYDEISYFQILGNFDQQVPGEVDSLVTSVFGGVESYNFAQDYFVDRIPSGGSENWPTIGYRAFDTKGRPSETAVINFTMPDTDGTHTFG